MPCIGSPTSAIRPRIVSIVNASGSTAATSSQRERRRDARVGRRPHRVGRRDRPVARVLAEVDEHADAVGDAPRGRRDRLVVDAPLDLLGQRLREPAHVGEQHSRLIGRQDVEPRCARRLRDTSAARARPSPRARRARSRARAAIARRSSGRGRSAGSRAARSPARASATCAARCNRGSRPRRAPAALSRTAKTVECPLGN